MPISQETVSPMIHRSDASRTEKVNYKFRSVNHRRHNVFWATQALVELSPKQFLSWLEICVHRRILFFGARMLRGLCFGDSHFCYIGVLKS